MVGLECRPGVHFVACSFLFFFAFLLLEDSGRAQREGKVGPESASIHRLLLIGPVQRRCSGTSAVIGQNNGETQPSSKSGICPAPPVWAALLPCAGRHLSWMNRRLLGAIPF